MIKSNYCLGVNMVFYYLSSNNINVCDIIQVENVGLIDAVASFDPNLGNRFSTYAFWKTKMLYKKYYIVMLQD